MANRREFLLGAAAVGLPAVSGLAPAVAGRVVQPVALHKVLFDDRLAQGRAFGSAARRLGLSVHAMQGDVTEFWYHELDRPWRKRPFAIAGLAHHGPLFVLERLGWDRGLRVTLRAKHIHVPDGALEHTISAPSALAARLAPLANGGDAWPALMAQVLSACPSGESASLTCSVRAMTGTVLEEPLFSWVIAPIRQA